MPVAIPSGLGDKSRVRDFTALALIALVFTALHVLTNGQYGFHRDELAVLDDARYLDWGYVAYPPLAPFIARVALEAFGPSLVGVRLFAALAQAVAMALTGWMARDMGARRPGQALAAIAAGTAPLSLAAGALFQYVSFDYLWWVLTAFFMVRLLKSGEPRWWLAIGAAIGAGLLTKYTILFLAAGLAIGVLLTPARRYIRSRYLWMGAAIAVVIFLPNLIWQIRHDFISLDFLNSIHARDVRIGRTDGFLIDQLYVTSNVFAIPLWIAGLLFYFRKSGETFKPLGWMFVIPFALFLVARGRGYYMAPAYPMLLAAGAVSWEHWMGRLRSGKARLLRNLTWGGIAICGALAAAIALPIAPVNSSWWRFTGEINGEFREEIGWPELAQTVAGIYYALPEGERASAGILTGNYGEAGAINLYGPERGLPRAISGVNSYWLRGFGDPPPETVIVLGHSRDFLNRNFESCRLAGAITNRYGVANEETTRHPDIFVCRGLRKPWQEFWKENRHFG